MANSRKNHIKSCKSPPSRCLQIVKFLPFSKPKISLLLAFEWNSIAKYSRSKFQLEWAKIIARNSHIPSVLDQNFKDQTSPLVFIRVATRRFIAALPTPLLPLIKISSLRKASLAPLKSKFRCCANSFNKIQTPFLPIVSIKILSPLQVVYDQNSIIADCISKALPLAPHHYRRRYYAFNCLCRSSKRRKAVRIAYAL